MRPAVAQDVGKDQLAKAADWGQFLHFPKNAGTDLMADPEAVFLMRATHIERGPDFKRGLGMPDATR